MDGQAEVLRDPLHQPLCVQAFFLGTCRLDKGHDLVGDLVRSVRPSFDRQQSGETLAFEVCLGFVKGRAGDPEAGRDIDNGLTLGAYAAQHLVTHLHQVPRIKEIAVAKGGILNVLRVRIHGSALGESKQLGVGFRGRCHCKHNYATNRLM